MQNTYRNSYESCPFGKKILQVLCSNFGNPLSTPRRGAVARDSIASSVSVVTSIGKCELCENRRRLRKHAEFGNHLICNRCYENYRSYDTE